MTYSAPQLPTDSQDKSLQPQIQPSAKTAENLNRLSRRFFLGTGVGAAGTAAVALVQPAAAAEPLGDSACQASPPSGSVTANTTACGADPPPYRLVEFNPTCITPSQKGELNLPLSVELGPFTYQCAADTTKQVMARTFKGTVPGPSMVIDPGDRIQLKITNKLPPNMIGDKDGECPASDSDSKALLNHPSCFDTFNMHFHGLHVSPGSYCIPTEDGLSTTKVLSSDDVLYQLPPREHEKEPFPKHNWCVWLPEFHAPGTHWYHAHRHGSTGLQVSNGMAGAIIIRERPEYQIVSPTDDKIWIIQEIIPPSQTDENQQDKDLAVYQRGGIAGGGTQGDFLVNGRFQPTITLQARQIQRWRFINANATPRGFMKLKLLKINDDPNTPPRSSDDLDPTKGALAPLWLIAVDGISFYGKPSTLIGRNGNAEGCDGWDVAAGNRADFLVQLDPGWYKVVKDTSGAAQGGSTAAQVLAYVKVEPSPAGSNEQTIPEKVPGIPLESPDNPYKRYLRPITDAEITKEEERSIVFSSTGRGTYLINGDQYNPVLSDVTVDLGACEQWSLTTTIPQGRPPFGGAAHPFHIHVNPFQIVGDKIDPNGPDEPSNWRFWDTIAVSNGQNIKIRSRFVDYSGTFVFHCHILIHEDQGMMKNITVKNTAPVKWPDMPYKGTLPEGVGVPPCTSLSNDGQYVMGPALRKVFRQRGDKCKPLPPIPPSFS